MKTLIRLLLSVMFLFGCTKEAVLPNPDSTILDVTSQPTWTTEPLNTDYVIQFPKGYTGNGKVGFEGNTFSKYREDKSVSLNYFFCSPTFCTDYGTIIPIGFTGPYIKSVQVGSKQLDQTVEIRQENQLRGVFYFAAETQAQGILYLFNPQSRLLQQSLSVQYPIDAQAEVLGILQTIRLK